MIDDNTKRDIKRHLVSAGFDASVVDELICERKRLRDEMAMAAVSPVMAQLYAETKDTLEAVVFKTAVAMGAYEIADAMMEARKQ